MSLLAFGDIAFRSGIAFANPVPHSCYSQESFCKLEGVIFWEAGEIPARPRHCKRGGPIQDATVHQDGKADRTGDA
jgi:hypothetical protein